MAKLIQRLVEPPRPCSYLPEATASLDVRVMTGVSSAELENLLRHGWRRFGPTYFRPACLACMECVSLRVPVAGFAPDKTQRRILRNGARFRRVVGVPRVDDERLALYARWHHQREEIRLWPSSAMNADGYALDFAFPHPAAREAAFYDDAAGGRLVGLGLWDETPRALSAVYAFYDPDYARESLGVLNVVSMIGEARARGIDHVYLGYRVSGCASLRYKARYAPHELLVGSPRLDEEPLWQLASDAPVI
jgi:arginine-tRNA-protein transferase